MDRVKRKNTLEHAQNVQIQIIWVFAIHLYILQYRMILLADSEGPDQTARLRSLIWAFAAHICSKTTFSHSAALIMFDQMFCTYLTLRKQLSRNAWTIITRMRAVWWLTCRSVYSFIELKNVSKGSKDRDQNTLRYRLIWVFAARKPRSPLFSLCDSIINSGIAGFERFCISVRC